MESIDAVLPLIRKDYDRFLILQKTIEKYFVGLNTCHIVVPHDDVSFFKSKIDSGIYIVSDELDFVPDLLDFEKVPGWCKQQIIKFAAHKYVSSKFYLTLDADVFCVRPVNHSDLIVDHRAISRRTKEDYHPDWYKNAERILKTKRSGYTHGVTPAILSTEAVSALLRHIEIQSNKPKEYFYRKLKSLKHKKRYTSSWATHLLLNRPWTEYSLYNTFLESENIYKNYHIDKGPFAIYNHSVWREEQFNDWDLTKVLEDDADSYFCVIQSTCNVPIELIHQKLSKLFG